MFSFSNELIIFVSIYCLLNEITLHCLNPNLGLNLCAAVIVQSMITLIANSPLEMLCLVVFVSCIKICQSLQENISHNIENIGIK